jgi:SAM-dependent methyltransferase
MDRILEAYNGSMGVEFMRKTRERMAWICSYVRGPRVLDVGCSQGILPILLGRSGFVVQGLDINPEAIEYATNELKKEVPSIQRSVTFSVGNFAQSEFSAQKYDTVIMGEVLEHLTRPDLFISKAFEALQDKGLLLITVPFGINDDPDHKQTFYLSKMMELLCPCFLVKEERYFDGWIGFVAERRNARTEVVPVADIHDLVNVETAVFKRERRLLDRITDLQTKYKNQGDANLGLKNSVVKAESEIEKLAKANAELERAKSVAEGEAARQKSEVAKAVSEVEKLAKANAELAKDLANEKAWAAEHKKQFDQFLKETESKRKELEDKLAQERLLRRDYDRVVKQRDRLEKLYKKLSEAKLGRLTLAYWRLKDGIKSRRK